MRLESSLADPTMPAAPGWVRLRPELAGVCGSDVAVAHAKMSFVLSGFYAAERAVPGHEIVAVVAETGSGVTSVTEGDRVAVDPVLSCLHRGFDPVCRACQQDLPYVCQRFDQPGQTGMSAPALGFDMALGGGWGEHVIAHESQLHPVGSIPSHRAVLAEPASIALHAALRWDGAGERAVVIGPGTIGLLTTAALRQLYPALDIAVVVPGAFGADHALGVGATRTLPAGADAVRVLADSDGSRLIRPRMARTPILADGVDVVFDSVGSPSTIDLALHMLRPGGTLVLVGGAGQQPMDWSLVWNRQITVRGSINFGPEPRLSGRLTMDQVTEWLGEPDYPVDGLVTHRFPLDRFGDALSVASRGPAASAVKVVLQPNPDIAIVAGSQHAKSRGLAPETG